MKAPFLSFVITNWRATEVTLTCLEQFGTGIYPQYCYEIIIVDNCATNKSKSAFLSTVTKMASRGVVVKYLPNKLHVGLTGSLNMAAESISKDSKYLVRFDNDVFIEPGMMEKMINFMEADPTIGLLGPRILYSKSNKLNAAAIYLSRYGGKNKIVDVTMPTPCDTILGAFMITRVKAVVEMGRWFNEELFLFHEEPELSIRLKLAGYYCYYYPDACAYHDAGTSTSRHSQLSLYMNHRNSIIVYFYPLGWVGKILYALNVFPRVIVRSIRLRSIIPFWGVIDGLRGKRLTVTWWNAQLLGRFVRPY